jgi:hypothetical protein
MHEYTAGCKKSGRQKFCTEKPTFLLQKKSGACEKMGQVPQCTGRSCSEIKIFFQISTLV